ncbi:response regulator [Streptomyces sp. NBC_00046]|uniref:response regulator n=1 Tax=Streptomyces sp. NBC_00046 TaxID=2975626 RepID=UPI00324CBD07
MGAEMRILLVEDHPIVRLGLRAAVEMEPDMTIVGEAGTVADAIAAAHALTPSVLILALRLEGELRGAEVCRVVKRLPQPPAVLVYTAFDSAADASTCFLAGADAFVHRRTDRRQLITSIRDTYRGRRVWMPSAAPAEGAARARPRGAPGLTPREEEVLGLMLLRYSNAQIGETLQLQLPTVKTHVRGLLRKLGLASRRDLF